MENCPICNEKITEKNIKDYGYNTFNIGEITCQTCNFKITYNCVEKINQYINLWNKDVANIKKLLSSNKEDKTKFLQYLIFNQNKYLLKEIDNYNTIIKNKDTVINDKKILKEHNINLEITELGEILIPKELEKNGIKEFIINTLKLKSKIKMI